MNSKIRNLTILLLVIISIASVASATETTWRHSGFQLYGYDINMSLLNITLGNIIEAKNIGGVIYADQYSSIQESLNSIPYHGDVKIKKGNYSVTSTIIINNSGTYDFTGSNLVLADNVNTSMLYVSASDVTINGGNFDGNKVNQGGSDTRSGIRVFNSDNITIQNVNVHNFYHQGIDVVGSNVSVHPENVKITNNIANNNGLAGIYVGYYARDVLIKGNTCSFNGGSSPYPDENGITIGDGSSDIIISENICNSNANQGIDIDDSTVENVNITIISNQLTENVANGITVQNSNRSIISNNIVTGNGITGHCIYVRDSNFTSLSSNTCDGAMFNGVTLYNTTSTSMVGGIIKNNLQDGLDMFDADFSTISGITFSNNGQSNNNTYYDMLISWASVNKGSENNTIIGNTFRSTGVNRTRYAITEDTYVNWNIISLNMASGNTVANYSTTGSNTLLINNI